MVEQTLSWILDNATNTFTQPTSETENAEWAAYYSLIVDPEKFQRIGCRACAAYTFPKSKPEVIALGADFIAWLFLLDDQYGEASGKQKFAQSMDVFRNIEYFLNDGKINDGPDTTFVYALQNIMARARAIGANKIWEETFRDSMLRYMVGCITEHYFRSSKTLPTFGQYKELRLGSSGALLVFDFLWLDQPYQLTKPISPTLQHLRARAAMLCSWINDIFSRHKDQIAQDPMNLVRIIMHEQNVDVDTACRLAAQLYEKDLATLLADAEHYSTSMCPSEWEHFLGACRWVDGSRAWSMASRRYAATQQ